MLYHILNIHFITIIHYLPNNFAQNIKENNFFSTSIIVSYIIVLLLKVINSWLIFKKNYILEKRITTFSTGRDVRLFVKIIGE